ncbi:hypothetical protein LJC63_05475 [Ruminococcaceae bacterium OttesenSCG-928-L11]|nr:hypothetical protein [Ruminococcaceae bacterium OttesenSCG-928-L11]
MVLTGAARRRLAGFALLLLIPAVVLFPRRKAAVAVQDTPLATVEEYVKGNLPFSNVLRKGGVELRYIGGKREQSGIFLTDDQLFRRVNAPEEGVVAANNAAVLRFAEYLMDDNRSFYFALIPTAVGVNHQYLPSYAPVYDQRRMMEEVYRELSGRLTGIDTYIPLNTNRGHYLYYRTEDNLSAYGGYVVYSTLAKRMGVADASPYSYYDIVYADSKYYGKLYQTSPRESIRPDVLLQFRYTKHPREYIVTHYTEEGTKVYHSLFVDHMKDLGREMDMYLGGLSTVIDIRVSAPYNRKLLIFGDRTAQAYLPFLVNHYNQVTFVDLSGDSALYADITPEAYDQVLMVYSVDTYVATDGVPARIEALVPEE